MAILLEAKRAKAGNSLQSYQAQIIGAVNQLKGIKTQLTQLKTDFGNDDDFTQSDIGDIDIALTYLTNQVNSI